MTVKTPIRDATIYVCGLAVIGLVVGFYAGGSGTPVVATALPLIFGLIGGAGGLYLGVAKVDQSQDAFRLRFIGIGLALFGVAILAGTIWGASERTGRPIYTFLPGTSSQEPNSQYKLVQNPAEALALALLDARIRAFGVKQSDADHILALARKELADKRYGLDRKRLMQVVDTAENTSQLLQEEVAATNQPQPGLSALRQSLLWRSALLDSVSNNRSDVMRHAQRLYVDEIARSTRNVLNDPGVEQLSRKLRGKLAELHGHAVEASNWLSSVNWAAKTQITESVDEFIKVGTGKASPSTDEKVPVLVIDPNKDQTQRLF